MNASAVEQFALLVIPIVLAVVLHEIAHGVVAYWRGDPTAKEAGRLTLNPLPHIDPFGSVVFPAILYLSNAPFLFGWARPVPVDISRLRNPKADMVLVALAGPLTNLALAVLFAQALRWLSPGGDPRAVLAGDGALSLGFEVALTSLFLNIGLAVFNLLPILPLDGGRVVVGLLPLRLARLFVKTERFGLLLVMLLSGTQLLGRVTGPLRWWLLDALL